MEAVLSSTVKSRNALTSLGLQAPTSPLSVTENQGHSAAALPFQAGTECTNCPLYKSLVSPPSPRHCGTAGKWWNARQRLSKPVSFLPSPYPHCSTVGKKTGIGHTGEGGGWPPHTAKAAQTPSPAACPTAGGRWCRRCCACAPSTHTFPTAALGRGSRPPRPTSST